MPTEKFLLNALAMASIGAGALLVTALESMETAMPLWVALITWLAAAKLNGSVTR